VNNRRILIVDDEDSYRATIMLALQLEGYSVLGASSGKEALELFETGSLLPELIILDLNMPVMSGAEFLKNLRTFKDARYSKLPVIIASGEVSIESELTERVSAVIKKPFELTALFEKIKAVLVSY